MSTLEERVAAVENALSEVLRVLDLLTKEPLPNLETQHQSFVERIRAAKR